MYLSKILRREVKRKIPRIVHFKNTVLGHNLKKGEDGDIDYQDGNLFVEVIGI